MDDVPRDSAPRFRIALVGCGGLLGDIISSAVSGEEDLEVVADLPSPAPGESLPAIDADLVLWNGAEVSRPAEWLIRIGRRTCPRVLATVSDGREAWLWELVPHRQELGALSPATLVETIRGLATADGRAP